MTNNYDEMRNGKYYAPKDIGVRMRQAVCPHDETEWQKYDDPTSRALIGERHFEYCQTCGRRLATRFITY